MNAPNLLFVFADQMRGFDMNCAGNPDIFTPNFDRLARQGALVEKTYANCPVCGPSRAILLTGTLPFRNRVVANDLPMAPDFPTIGERLQSAGYATGYIGKWHLDGPDRSAPIAPERRHGFEFWRAYNCSHQYFDAPIYDENDALQILPGYEPQAQTDVALEFLAQQTEKPWALVLSWGPPHDPYPQVPQQWRDFYDPEKLALRPNVAATPPLADGCVALGARQSLALYYAAISALDEQLGRLLDWLDENGLSENTLVVFASDHGDMLFSHGRIKKQVPFEEAIRLPFLARWPGAIPAASRPEILWSTVDWTPTFLDLLGIKAEGFDGRGHAEALRGGAAAQEPVLLMELVTTDEGLTQNLREWRGVRTANHLYARFADGTPWLLFDMRNDPFQLDNLVNEADLVAQMDAILSAQLERAGDESGDWREQLRRVGQVENWNERERVMHGDNARLVDSPA